MRVSLSLRADYAVRAMLALAAFDGAERPLSVRAISRSMAIPVRFLPHVMADLGRAGLVVGQAGRNGGYRLGRSAAGITVLDIVDAVDPDGPVARCVLRGGPCRPDGKCAVHDVIAGATVALHDAMSGRSLADIARYGGFRLPEPG